MIIEGKENFSSIPFNVSSCVSTVSVVYMLRILYKMPINVAPRFAQETAIRLVHQFKVSSQFIL